MENAQSIIGLGAAHQRELSAELSAAAASCGQDLGAAACIAEGEEANKHSRANQFARLPVHEKGSWLDGRGRRPGRRPRRRHPCNENKSSAQNHRRARALGRGVAPREASAVADGHSLRWAPSSRCNQSSKGATPPLTKAGEGPPCARP